MIVFQKTLKIGEIENTVRIETDESDLFARADSIWSMINFQLQPGNNDIEDIDEA